LKEKASLTKFSPKNISNIMCMEELLHDALEGRKVDLFTDLRTMQNAHYSLLRDVPEFMEVFEDNMIEGTYRNSPSSLVEWIKAFPDSAIANKARARLDELGAEMESNAVKVVPTLEKSPEEKRKE
jgi:hypothetical protein